jgi:hypothetical protein
MFFLRKLFNLDAPINKIIIIIGNSFIFKFKCHLYEEAMLLLHYYAAISDVMMSREQIEHLSTFLKLKKRKNDRKI